MKNTVTAIVIHETQPQGLRSGKAVAQLKNGPMTGQMMGEDVTCQVEDSESRRSYFEGSADLAGAVGARKIELGEGLFATCEKIDPLDARHLPLRGPGASFVTSARGMPGIRQRTFPELPGRWAAAIHRAATGHSL